jgi:hypothetical protein
MTIILLCPFYHTSTITFLRQFQKSGPIDAKFLPKLKSLLTSLYKTKRTIGTLVVFLTPHLPPHLLLHPLFLPLGMVTTGQIFGQVATTLYPLDG